MAQNIDDRRRQLVPRWRPFRIAAGLGLLSSRRSEAQPRHTEAVDDEIMEARGGWVRHRSRIHAADLVDTALVTGRYEIATDAAEFLLRADVSEMTHLLARAVLLPNEPRTIIGEPVELSREQRYRRIARNRLYLRRTPRDPIRLVDLARDYSIVGQNRPARHVLRQAIALAPRDRFVLRAAARFFLHAQDPEAAVKLLTTAPSTKDDPWLMAAEIVACRITDRTSIWLKRAEQIVESGRYAAWDISELAAVLGTLEYEDGTRRGMNRFLRRALADPTENTLAQVGWIARHLSKFDRPVPRANVARAYEAQGWDACLRGDYVKAVELAWKWLRDEPFATRPAFFGSWVAATALGDHVTAAAFVSTARLANRDHPRLIAQLAFCYAYENRLEEAEQLLRELPNAIQHNPDLESSARWDVVTHADRGLIAYRRGHADEGRRLYELAIRLASENDEKELAATALLYYAREEARAKGLNASVLTELRRTLEAYPPSVRPVYERLLNLPIKSTHAPLPIG